MNIVGLMNLIHQGLLPVNRLFLGGSHGRESATAKGVTICIREAAKKKGMILKGQGLLFKGLVMQEAIYLNLCMTQVPK